MCSKTIIYAYVLAVMCMQAKSSNCPAGSTYGITKLEASDTSTSAGTRKSTSTLKMVHSGSSRSAAIAVTVNGANSSGYPKWSGNNVTGSAGSTSATYSGSFGTSATVDVKNDQGCSDSESVDIEIISENEVTIAIDSSKFQKFQDIINLCLALICENPDPPDFSVQIENKQKFVDYYNDGEKVGYYNSYSGTASLSFGSVKGEKVVPTSIPGLSFSLGGEFKAFSMSIGGSLTYDQSKSNPWIASSGTVSGGASVQAYAEAVIGLNTENGDDWGLVFSVSGETSVSCTGSLSGSGNKIVCDATVTCGTLHVEASADVKLGAWIEWEVASVETDLFSGNSFESGEVTILTIGDAG